MAKTITISVSDDEFVSLQKAFASEDTAEADITEDYIKSKLISVLKSRVMGYDDKEARKKISYTSFDPS